MDQHSRSLSSQPSARGSELVISSYDALATEYYNVERHPTCANFREGSRLLLTDWLGPTDADLAFCEIGAGKSLLAEIAGRTRSRLDKVFLVDSSQSMLAYSNEFATIGAQLIFADASRIPLPSSSIDVVVSSLGDPYNISSVWSEVRRLLRPRGRVFFTTPSYDWAAGFRTRQTADIHLAEFELSDGELVYVPSYVLPTSQQVEMMAGCGLAVERVVEVPVSALGRHTISPKLLSSQGQFASILTGYALTASGWPH